MIVAVTLILSAYTIAMFRFLKPERLDFFDGIFLGMIYFYVIPFYFAVFSGSVPSLFIAIEDYVPSAHANGTLVILLGWITVLVFYAAVNLFGWKKAAEANENPNIRSYVYVAAIYMLLSAVALYLLQSHASAGHWHYAVRELQESSAIYVIVKGFSNAFRFCISGYFLHAYFRGHLNKSTVVLILAALLVFDVLTTYNRIGIVLFAVCITIIYIKHWKMIALIVVLSAPVVNYFSTTWTVFRGVHSLNGGEIRDIPANWKASREIIRNYPWAVNDSFGQAFFEADNLASLNFVVEDMTDIIGFQWGKTMFVRPLTTFIPNTIWKNKPPVFSTYVGLHGNGANHLAINSTIIGEAYGNFWIWFPVPLAFLMLIYGYLFRVLNSYLPGTECAGFFVGLAIWRFDMNFASSAVYAVVLAIICTKIIPRKARLLGRCSVE